MVALTVVIRSRSVCLGRIVVVLCCLVMSVFRHYRSPLWNGTILLILPVHPNVQQFITHNVVLKTTKRDPQSDERIKRLKPGCLDTIPRVFLGAGSSEVAERR